MNPREIVRIVTDSQPKGLVPDVYAVLLFPKNENKWYALRMETPPSISYPSENVVSHDKIFLL